MGSTRAPVLAAAACGLLVLGCGGAPDLLPGEWVSVDAPGPRMTWVLPEGDTAMFIVALEPGPDTSRLPWRSDPTRTPVHLDLGPWPDGPLEGRTLYGIVELHGPDRFRVDLEPGNAEGGGDARPTAFTAQAVSFVRKLPGPS